MKFALISNVLPPSGSGQGIALYNLLKGIDSNKICLISHNDYSGKKELNQGKITKKILCNYYTIKRMNPFFIRFFLKFGASNSNLLLTTFLYIRSYRFSKIIHHENCTHVVACTADLFDPYCSYLAAKRLGLKLIFYIFDDYFCQWILNPKEYSFAQKYGKEIINYAKTIIVPNEFLQREYLEKYNVKTQVIRNSIEINLNKKISGENFKNYSRDTIRIIYTGDIYEAQRDAIINLNNVIESVIVKKFELHIFTGRSREELEKQGLIGSYILHPSIPYNKIRDEIQLFDILFLPLSFNSLYPSLIATSSPGKIGDYLDASKPILVHGPKNSFISWYFVKNNCGVVVDENDPQLLLQGLLKIINEDEFRLEISKNAKKMANEDFNSRTVQEEFLKILEQ